MIFSSNGDDSFRAYLSAGTENLDEILAAGSPFLTMMDDLDSYLREHVSRPAVAPDELVIHSMLINARFLLMTAFRVGLTGHALVIDEIPIIGSFLTASFKISQITWCEIFVVPRNICAYHMNEPTKPTHTTTALTNPFTTLPSCSRIRLDQILAFIAHVANVPGTIFREVRGIQSLASLGESPTGRRSCTSVIPPWSSSKKSETERSIFRCGWDVPRRVNPLVS